jgi:hypothetical protein
MKFNTAIIALLPLITLAQHDSVEKTGVEELSNNDLQNGALRGTHGNQRMHCRYNYLEKSPGHF